MPADNVEEIIRTLTDHSPLKALKKKRLRIGKVDVPSSLAVNLYKSLANLQKLDTDMLIEIDDDAPAALMTCLVDLKVLDHNILRHIKAHPSGGRLAYEGERSLNTILNVS